MKMKFSKAFGVLVLTVLLLCLSTVVLADEAEYVDQILAPIGGGYTDLDGNFILDTDGEFVVLTADFPSAEDIEASWNVIDGKDVVSLTKRDGFENEAILTALSDGEATIIAYLEDDSQRAVTAKVLVSQQTVETATFATLKTSVEGDGNIIRKAESGAELPLGTSYANQHDIGMVVDLTAVENNHPFKYWVVRHGTDKDVIVSTEKHYTFVLARDTTVAAVFDQTGSLKGTNAIFLYNNIVASNMYVKTLSKSAPTAPYQRNYEFLKWVSEQVDADTVLANGKVDQGELTQGSTFTATYTKKDAEFEIEVIGGSGSGTYAYGEAVTATVTATAQEGKQFLFWSKDGAPVSYEETYAFSAMQDCTVSAVFGAAVETDEINMVMQTPVDDGNVIAFTFERYVPETYTFVSSGFVVSKVSDCVLGDSANNLMEAVSYRTGVRTQLTKSLNKVSGVSTYYARGYVIYMDEGAVKIIYTAPQKITIE